MVDTLKDDLERREREFERKVHHAERAHDSEEDSWNKANDAIIASGTLALRTAVIINGGAAVATLAFIGSLVTDAKLPLGIAVNQLTAPIKWFAIGVAVATLAMGIAYLVNYCNAGLISSRTQNWEAPFIRETIATTRWRFASNALTVVAILCAIASLGLFIYGMLAIQSAISILT